MRLVVVCSSHVNVILGFANWGQNYLYTQIAPLFLMQPHVTLNDGSTYGNMQDFVVPPLSTCLKSSNNFYLNLYVHDFWQNDFEPFIFQILYIHVCMALLTFSLILASNMWIDCSFYNAQYFHSIYHAILYIFSSCLMWLTQKMMSCSTFYRKLPELKGEVRI